MYRVNAQSRALEEAFIRHGMPYKLVGGVRFYQRWEIKDIIAYLRFIHNPSDSLGLTRIINVPGRGIGIRTMTELKSWAHAHDTTLHHVLEMVTDEKGPHLASRARFALTGFLSLCAPAHQTYPTRKVERNEALATHLGSRAESNERTIRKYIHPDGVQSCQLVMGLTELEPGCVWNSMPCHTHERRMEVYMYFDVADDARVFHLMGKPDETRHIVTADGQAIISPSWSIHSGVGTAAYTFCWGMGGENQTFDDMDHLTMNDIL